jgi:hypothetical protein
LLSDWLEMCESKDFETPEIAQTKMGFFPCHLLRVNSGGGGGGGGGGGSSAPGPFGLGVGVAVSAAAPSQHAFFDPHTHRRWKCKVAVHPPSDRQREEDFVAFMVGVVDLFVPLLAIEVFLRHEGKESAGFTWLHTLTRYCHQKSTTVGKSLHIAPRHSLLACVRCLSKSLMIFYIVRLWETMTRLNKLNTN